MKKVALVLNFPFIVQLIDNSETQLASEYLQFVVLIICFATAAIVMMLIPVVLCYSMIGNFFSMNGGSKKIKNEIASLEHNTKYLKLISDDYVKATANFFKNFMALASWNLFSLIYIVYWFDSFSHGVEEYFCFPFAIFQSLGENDIFESIYEFQSNWLFMGIIILLTFSFSFLGKYVGKEVGKNKIKKTTLVVPKFQLIQ